jgi:hypothetical protein
MANGYPQITQITQIQEELETLAGQISLTDLRNLRMA